MEKLMIATIRLIIASFIISFIYDFMIYITFGLIIFATIIHGISLIYIMYKIKQVIKETSPWWKLKDYGGWI